MSVNTVNLVRTRKMATKDTDGFILVLALIKYSTSSKFNSYLFTRMDAQFQWPIRSQLKLYVK